MKRLFAFASLLLVLSSGSVFAVRVLGLPTLAGIGGSYLTINQKYSTTSGTENLVLSGAELQTVFMTGTPLGLIGSIGIGLASNGSVDGTKIDLSSYGTRVMFNFLMGLGYRIPINKKVSVLVGVGGHAVGGIIGSPSGLNYLDLAYVAGLGAMTKLNYFFTPNFGAYLNLEGSYDPFALVDGINVSFKNGFSYSAGLGVEVLY